MRDMVTLSGREELPIGDRVGLLVADGIWLRLLSGNGMEAHDKANLLELIHLIVYCHQKPALRHIPPREISHAECLVMAWRRGGYQEYKKIKREQTENKR